jgi:predicted secreted Zn-dependent protease
MNKPAIIIFIILILQASNSYAETFIITKYKNYPIGGHNIEEIRQSLLNNGLKDAHGNIFAAETTPKFTWKYNFGQSENGCFIKSADVELQITYQLPQVSPAELNDKAKKEWDIYYNAIKMHEDGHAEIMREAANDLAIKLEQLPTAATCSKMAIIANLRAFAILKKQDQANVDYDLATNHGTWQGATLLTSW